MKLFSGDDKGKVVFSAVDLDQVTLQLLLLRLHSAASVFFLFSPPDHISSAPHEAHSNLPARIESIDPASVTMIQNLWLRIDANVLHPLIRETAEVHVEPDLKD